MASKKYDISELQAFRDEWADIPVDVIPEKHRNIFQKRKNAIDMYIDGYKMSEIERHTSIKHSNLPKLLNKCISLNNHGIMNGYIGLIPQKRLAPKDFSGEDSRDYFVQLLSYYSELPEFLKGNYFGIAPFTTERVMNIRTLHDKFLSKCKELQITDDKYPFNTDTQGYYALYRYIQKIDKENIELSANRESKDAKQKLLSTGIGKKYFINPIAPFSGVQVDGHIIDIIYTTQVRMEDGTIQSMPAHRCWLFVVIDIATRCIIGYSTSQEMNYNQYDVLRAFQNAILPHQKIEFKIPGYYYPENGGFPSMALAETKNALFDMVMLDNAKSHLSKTVRDKALNVLKCALNYGSVATPEIRGIVERFFRTLESKGFHRLPMTTDSNVRGLKRRNPEYKAVKYNVTYDDIKEVIEQLIIQYNNSPHESLYNNTPLQEIERKICEYGMMPTIASGKMIEEIKKLTYFTVTRKVSGNKQNGKRPYISYANARYRNDLLSSSNIYLGKTLTLLVNPDDVSTVEAFAEDGTPLGTLIAVGEKGMKSHSIKSRKAINQYAKQNKIENSSFSTPITAYEQELERRAPYSKRDRTRADILRREEGKQTYSEQKQYKDENPSPVINKETVDKKSRSMPTAEEVQNMTAEEMWKYIKRA
jgi:Integrase core domain.